MIKLNYGRRRARSRALLSNQSGFAPWMDTSVFCSRSSTIFNLYQGFEVVVPFRYSEVVNVFITALECREAIQIQLNYQRAHHRLANLYLRLGEEEKALFHFKKAWVEADSDAIAKAKLLLSLLNKCEHSNRIQDWNTIISDSTTTPTTPAKGDGAEGFSLQFG